MPGLLVAIALALLYLVLPTRVFYWDGIAFAITIEKAQSWRELIDVHHLLYDFIGWGEYKLLGDHVRALFLMQWTNCILGAVLILLAYRVFRSLGLSSANAAAWAAVLGVSASFWRFTTDADAYILANLFLIAAWCAIPRSPVSGALLHLSAMLFHQLSALFYPVALALLWKRSPREFGKNAGEYTAISVGGALGTYALAYRLVLKPQTGTFASWLTYHSDIPFVFTPLTSLKWLALGTARLFVGGKWTPAAAITGSIALALLIMAVAGMAKSGLKTSPMRKEWPLALWALVYALFLCFWEPNNTFYRLFYIVPLIGMLAVAIQAARSRHVGLLAAALFCWNFFQYIYPQSRTESNPPLEAALKYWKQWPPGTGVIYAQFVPDLWTISYFNPQVSWMAIQPPNPSAVAERVAAFARDGGKVYLDWTYLHSTGVECPRLTFRQVPIK